MAKTFNSTTQFLLVSVFLIFFLLYLSSTNQQYLTSLFTSFTALQNIKPIAKTPRNESLSSSFTNTSFSSSKVAAARFRVRKFINEIKNISLWLSFDMNLIISFYLVGLCLMSRKSVVRGRLKKGWLEHELPYEQRLGRETIRQIRKSSLFPGVQFTETPMPFISWVLRCSIYTLF